MEEFVRKSNIRGDYYDYFKTVKIRNIKQVCAYLLYGLTLLDVRPGVDMRTREPILLFYFDKEESKEAFDLWCKHELPLKIEDGDQ